MFAQLATHYAHITYQERNGVTEEQVVLLLLIHVTYPKETLLDDQLKSIPEGVPTVVAVLHDADHYAVLEINIRERMVRVYDGLYRDLDRWLDYVFNALKRCMLCDVGAANLCDADA